MAINIKNCEISNCGTGIKMNGNINANINGIKFMGNVKDMDFKISDLSNINIEEIKSSDCKTDSINIEIYNSIIDNSIEFISKQNEFQKEVTDNLKELLLELKESKENPSKLKVVLREIYSISKDIGLPILSQYLMNNIMMK